MKAFLKFGHKRSTVLILISFLSLLAALSWRAEIDGIIFLTRTSWLFLAITFISGGLAIAGDLAALANYFKKVE